MFETTALFVTEEVLADGRGLDPLSAAWPGKFIDATARQDNPWKQTHNDMHSDPDHCAISVSTFNKLADLYRQKYMGLAEYDASYRAFCEALRPTRPKVLDAACGPGNASRYLVAQRPGLELLGIDLAPRMVELAREAVPSARFAVHDLRNLPGLNSRFDGILCAFGLPYLSWPEAVAFIAAAGDALEAEGVLYLSTMLGRREDSGFEPCSTGDGVYVNYHDAEEIINALRRSGFAILRQWRLSSPAAAVKKTTDLIVIARKGCK